MSEQPLKEDIFQILRLLASREDLTQRDVSGHLGISLGKTNYLLKALIRQGLLKIKSFTSREEKLRKIRYILTKEGLEEKAQLTYYFLKRKEAEYRQLKEEAEKIEV